MRLEPVGARIVAVPGIAVRADRSLQVGIEIQNGFVSFDDVRGEAVVDLKDGKVVLIVLAFGEMHQCEPEKCEVPGVEADTDGFRVPAVEAMFGCDCEKSEVKSG